MTTDLDGHDEAFVYCYRRQRLAERIRELLDITNEATTATIPYHGNQNIVEVITRMRDRLTTADKAWLWNDHDVAIKACDQIDGSVTELKGLLKGLGVPFVERILP
jgi:hypothetical protein